MKTKILAVALAVAPFAASAAPLSYTFVEGGYNRLHLNNGGNGIDDTTADGAYLRGSYDLGTSGLNVFGNVGKVSANDSAYGYRVDTDLRQEELGLGYHQSMSDRVDFVAEGAWVRDVGDTDVTIGAIRTRDRAMAHGGRVAIGVRGQFSDMVEGLLKVNYYGGGDFEDKTFTGTAGVQVKFNETWGIVAGVESGKFDDVQSTRYNVGVRASF